MSTKIKRIGVPQQLFCMVIPPNDVERVRIHDGEIANAMLVRGCLGGAFSEMWFDPQLITTQTVAVRLRSLQERLGITFNFTFATFWEVDIQLTEPIPPNARGKIQTALRRLGGVKAFPHKDPLSLKLRFDTAPTASALDGVAALTW